MRLASALPSLLIAAASLACGSATPSASTEPHGGDAASARRVLDVLASSDEAPHLQWRGEYGREDVGLLFAVVDERGYRALVRTAAEPSDCDDCAGPRVGIDVVSGSLRGLRHAVALGPVRGPFPRARVLRTSPSNDVPESWAPITEIDLDGDGAADIADVVRCGAFVTEPRGTRACREVCHGVRDRDGNLAPERACFGFVPDVDDAYGDAK